VNKKANDTFAFDLDNRLDDFFSDSLPPQDQSPTPISDFPLKDLKSTILAIDWEITDDALDNFIYQIDALSERFKKDKVNQTHLKLLKSLGRYIRSQKSKAHPDTIKRIMAVYSTLEESVANDELSQNDKEKMLLEEVRQYKRLKADIARSRSTHVAKNGTKDSVKSEKISGLDEVIRAIEKLKSLMTSELGAIRQELEELRKK
jgi:hypothetical protein